MASRRERRPRWCGGRAGKVRRRRCHLCLLPGSRALRVVERGRGGWWPGRTKRVCAVSVQERVCERARVCGCLHAGEVVAAAAPWLGAGPGGIARFSPAGAGDLQAIPLYFRRELTSPALPPLETPLTVAPSRPPPPPIWKRGPSSVIPPPTQPLSINEPNKKRGPAGRLGRPGQPVAGAQDFSSRYCFSSSPRGPGSPRAGRSAGYGGEAWDATRSPPPSSRPGAPPHSLAHMLRLTLPISPSQAAHPPPSSHVPVLGPEEPKRPKHAGGVAETQPSCTSSPAGPNKSLAFNYSSGLILMQFPGDGGRGAGRP